MQKNGDMLASLGIGIAFIIYFLYFKVHGPAVDILSPYLAGWFFDQKMLSDIYGFDPALMFAKAPPEAWVQAANARGYSGDLLYPYLYPPIWASLMAPVTRVLDIPEYIYAVRLIAVLLVVMSSYFAWRLAGRQGAFSFWLVLTLVLFLVSVSGVIALSQIQPHILVVFLIIFGLERAQSGQSRVAGVAMALAATIKILPVFMIIVFFVRRDKRAMLTMILSGLAILGLSILLAGPELHLAYLDQMRNVGQQVYGSAANLTFQTSLFMAFGPENATHIGQAGPAFTAPMPRWITLVSMVFLVLGALPILWALQQRSSPGQEASLITALLIWVALWGPIGWVYYYLPALYFWPLVFRVYSARTATISTVAFLIFSSTWMVIFIWGKSGSVDLTQAYGTLLMFAIFLFFIYMGFGRAARK